MKQQDLDSIRAELKNLTDILALDTTNWNPATRPGILGKQNNAKLNIGNVKDKLAQAILRNSTTLLVDREFDGTGDIVESAQKNVAKNVLIDFLGLEKEFFAKIFTKKTQSLTFNSEIVSRLNILMAEVGQQISAESIPGITASSSLYGTVKTRAEMVAKLEKVLELTYGFELKQHLLRVEIFRQVVARLDQDSVNVVIVNVPDNFVDALKIFTKKIVVLNNENSAQDDEGTMRKATQEATEEKPATAPRARRPRTQKVKNAQVQESVDGSSNE